MLKVSGKINILVLYATPLCTKCLKVSVINSKEISREIGFPAFTRISKCLQSTYAKPNVLQLSSKKRCKNKKKLKVKPYEDLLKVLEVHKDQLEEENSGIIRRGSNINTTVTVRKIFGNAPLSEMSYSSHKSVQHISTNIDTNAELNSFQTDSVVLKSENALFSAHCNQQHNHKYNYSMDTKEANPAQYCTVEKEVQCDIPDKCETFSINDKMFSQHSPDVYISDHFIHTQSELENTGLYEEALVNYSDISEIHEGQPKLSKKKKGLSLSKMNREKTAKWKKEEQEKAAKESNLMQSLKAYFDVCLNANMLSKAQLSLLYYRHKSKMNKSSKVNDVEVYDILLSGWAGKGKLRKIKEMFLIMVQENISPSLQSYASYLECLSRSKKFDHTEARNVLSSMKENGYEINDIFCDCKFFGDQMEKVLETLRQLDPDFSPSVNTAPQKYTSHLLEKLNNKVNEVEYFPCKNIMPVEEMKQLAVKQMQLEVDGIVKLKSVYTQTDVSEKTLFLRKQLADCEKEWKEVLTKAFQNSIKSLGTEVRTQHSMSLYPYLIVMEPHFYVDIMLQEIRYIAESAEAYSPSINFLHKNVGLKVMNRYIIWTKKKNKVVNKVELVFKKYLEHYVSPEAPAKYIPRDCWNLIKMQNFEGPSVIGRFLYDILHNNARIRTDVLRPNSSSKQVESLFYSTYQRSGTHLKEEIRANPILCKLYSGAEEEELTFDVNVLPMLTPPRPWTSINSGGFIISPTPFIRLPEMALQQRIILSQVPSHQLYPSSDSLNILGLCPWIINKPILDLVLEVFRNNGNEELDIPLNPSTCPTPPKILPDMSKQERFKVHRERAILKRKRAEMYSLWCDTLYKLSIAEHFRHKIFWFPHNMDFRGRVYPTPPHFNHLGSDMARSILLFADGRPLGEKGLDWLKIHLINLTGFKKREPVCKRLQYANEILHEILNSADEPFVGNRWWMKSDEPWQTLACCKEIANAVRSPDHTKYVSHFPVHQDGSCNGLQHYAALGRDQHGAEQVNLHPGDIPQDVYSGVAALVEKQRKFEAEKGSKIAAVLDGFVKRKVVKQTVMTVVYGVTKYGARLQILKQLKDIPDFPQQYSWQAATYLMQKTFFSIQEMFTATREIQDWFTECAQVISQVCSQSVEWVTPLGLPIVQPYHHATTMRGPTNFGIRLDPSYVSHCDMFQRPNIMKQKNAFPPNFIHSLDSSHMMLTSLYCQREGILFVSVHDCFWTHAASIAIMNKVCREQFVALHNEPILENLSHYLFKKYSYSEKEMAGGKSKADVARRRLNKVLEQIPKKGTFQLENVLKSTYFFS